MGVGMGGLKAQGQPAGYHPELKSLTAPHSRTYRSGFPPASQRKAVGRGLLTHFTGTGPVCEERSGSAVPSHGAAGMVFSLRRDFCCDLNLMFPAVGDVSRRPSWSLLWCWTIGRWGLAGGPLKVTWLHFESLSLLLGLP